MKQVFVSGAGQVQVLDTPLPLCPPGFILVRTLHSLISTGTEGAAVAKRRGVGGILEKTSQSPRRIRQAISYAQRHGVRKAVRAIDSKLKDFNPLGYSSAGKVIEVAGGDMPFAPGDRVACIGSGYANHAEYAAIPLHLATVLPEGVRSDEAAFAALACIAMQGIRRLDLSSGERVGVIGLGLIGRLTLRLLPGLGFIPFGFDINNSRVRTAADTDGVESWSDPRQALQRIADLSDGHGLDGVVVCASTRDDQPLNLACDFVRRRGRVSIVGDVGLRLQRGKLYRKEIDVKMSCSYGIGRYDPTYEEQGIDYPLPYARWTEGRNLQHFVELLARRRLELRSLITARYPIAEASEAYARLKAADPSDFGIVFEYPAQPDPVHGSKILSLQPEARRVQGLPEDHRIRIAVIGTGAYARNVHIPNLRRLKDDFEIRAVVSRSGHTAAATGREVGASLASSDYHTIVENEQIDAVLVTTRHSTHAEIARAALKAGKHVLVEKPLATRSGDASELARLAAESGLVLRVGFNRRFAPSAGLLKQALGDTGRRLLLLRANVGPLEDHWSNKPEEGGRLLGEGVHYFDLSNWIFDAYPESVQASFVGSANATNPNVAVTLQYPDGSTAVVSYTTIGDPGLGKERYEGFGNGCSVSVEDFKSVSVHGRNLRLPRAARGDKGQLGLLQEFAGVIRGLSTPVRGADARDGAVATWIAEAARRSARTRKSVPLDLEAFLGGPSQSAPSTTD